MAKAKANVTVYATDLYKGLSNILRAVKAAKFIEAITGAIRFTADGDKLAITARGMSYAVKCLIPAQGEIGEFAFLPKSADLLAKALKQVIVDKAERDNDATAAATEASNARNNVAKAQRAVNSAKAQLERAQNMRAKAQVKAQKANAEQAALDKLAEAEAGVKAAEATLASLNSEVAKAKNLANVAECKAAKAAANIPADSGLVSFTVAGEYEISCKIGGGINMTLGNCIDSIQNKFDVSIPADVIATAKLHATALQSMLKNTVFAANVGAARPSNLQRFVHVQQSDDKLTITACCCTAIATASDNVAAKGEFDCDVYFEVLDYIQTLPINDDSIATIGYFTAETRVGTGKRLLAVIDNYIIIANVHQLGKHENFYSLYESDAPVSFTVEACEKGNREYTGAQRLLQALNLVGKFTAEKDVTIAIGENGITLEASESKLPASATVEVDAIPAEAQKITVSASVHIDALTAGVDETNARGGVFAPTFAQVLSRIDDGAVTVELTEKGTWQIESSSLKVIFTATQNSVNLAVPKGGAEPAATVEAVSEKVA